MEINEFLTYINVIRKRLWLILLLMIVTIGIIVAMVLAEPPVYRATVRLQVVTSDPLFSSVTTTDEELIAARNDYAEALMTYHVAWKTIGDLELSIDAVDLLSHISVNMEDVFITVNVEAETPELAFEIAETQVNYALDYYRNERARPAHVFRNFLSEELKEAGQVLEQANSSLLAFRSENNILQPNSEALAYQTLIRELELERDRTEIAAIRAEASAEQFYAKAENAIAEAEDAIEKNGEATAAYYQSLAEKYSSQAIDYEANGISQRAAVERYDKLIAEKRAELLALIQLVDNYNSLDISVNRAQNNYEFLWNRENEARLRESQARSVGFIEIIEPARYPDTQAASKLPRLVLIGGLLSLLAGIVLAFLLEFLESLSQQQPPTLREF
jgi:uncharacterized protein involved in exopolysaccharide biosynthesis